MEYDKAADVVVFGPTNANRSAMIGRKSCRFAANAPMHTNTKSLDDTGRRLLRLAVVVGAGVGWVQVGVVAIVA